MSRRRTSSINIRNFIGTTSLRTSRPLSITSMLPRVGVGGLQASTTTYFVRSVSCAFRSHSGKSRHANGGRPDRAAEAGDNRAFHGTTCQAALSREEYPPALPQLVAIDDCALSARHVVEDAALDARVAEQDQRCTIIIAARIARDLPSLREQLVDRQRCLRCRQAGRRQRHCQEQGLRPRETRDRRQRGRARGQMQKFAAGKFHSALLDGRRSASRHHSSLLFAARITLPHFSISSVMSFPKSAGEPGSGVLPKLASREFIFGSAKAALTSLLSLLMISVGVFLGAPRPHTAVAS